VLDWYRSRRYAPPIIMSDDDRRPRIQITDSTLIPERGQNTVFSAWRIAFAGSIILVIGLPLFIPDPYLRIFMFIKDGLIITFEVTIFAIILATAIGLLAGLGQISLNPILNRAVTVYVEVVRGIPLMVQLFFAYYAFGKIFPIDAVVAAVLAMGFCYGAYMGEIFRAGIQSVPKGQMEAALALGLSRGQAFRLVIVPQTIKIILPAIGNEFIALLKDSSLVSALALADLTRRGKEFQSQTFQLFEAYTMVALVYLVITLSLSRLVGILEERLNRNAR